MGDGENLTKEIGTSPMENQTPLKKLFKKIFCSQIKQNGGGGKLDLKKLKSFEPSH